MSLLNFFKLPKILAFFVGILISLTIIPGCLSLASNFSQSNEVDNQVNIEVAKSPQNSTMSLGVGLNGIAPWSPQLPFLDGFKSSRQWITQCTQGDPGCNGEWDTKEFNLLDLDENGWIKSLPAPKDPPKFTKVSTLLLREIPNLFPSGKYIVLYEGEGTIEYRFAAKKDETASTGGRDVINVDGTRSGGILLTITSTDPQKTGNYIRNIRVVQAEYEKTFESEIFNPTFIEKINKFSALRFMDWMKTNGSEQKEWANRPKPDIVSYTIKGAPIEIMVALSNKIKADPWFNMPHQATDEYMTNFAEIVKEKLDSALKVYVEFSNEVWNWQFKQSHYALKQGQARWGKSEEGAFFQWYGMRTAQMCDIWKDVFGNQKNRVECVIGTQKSWLGLENYALDCPAWVAEGNEPCYKHGIDAYAITGYFSGKLGKPENLSTVESWLNEPDGGFSKALKQLKEGGVLGDSKDSLPEVYNSFKYHKQVAQKKGLNLVAYEGGQHIAGVKGVVNNDKITQFFIELNRRPEMYDLYTELLENWKKAGGGLFMHFVDIGGSSKWGSWGALEYVEQDSSPKYNALMDFIKNNP